MKFTSCLLRVGGSHRVLLITPPHNPSYFFFLSDKTYQLFAQRRWFSPGTPASFTTTTDRHDIAEILLKVQLNNKKSNSYFFLHISLNQAHGEATQ